jgi:hypothetical protein
MLLPMREAIWPGSETLAWRTTTGETRRSWQISSGTTWAQQRLALATSA